MNRTFKGFYGLLFAGVLSLALMAGCGGGGATSDDNSGGGSGSPLAGTWKGGPNEDNYMYTFTDTTWNFTAGWLNGSCNANGTYSLNGNTVTETILYDGCDQQPVNSTWTWTYSISGNTLTQIHPEYIGDPLNYSRSFIKLGSYAILGRVADSSNVGISGVEVVLSGARYATTDSIGNYSITELANGSYTITPSKTGYTFNPASKAVTVNGANITGQDFVGSATGGGGGSSPSATGRMPDTNQTTSYTSTFGEDNDYTINPPSYTDNGNGTITDNVTGLMWQKQDDGTTRTWDNAGAYCDALTLGGYSDWRLPSQSELISIIDNGVYNPAINTTFFPSTISSYYWSSTTDAYYTSFAMVVAFGYGSSNDNVKTYPFSVRCVRGGQATPSLTDKGNGTVTDNGTLLTWQQGESSAMTWEAALTYCEGLSLAGSTDWRLPNHKELMSLVDYTRYNPSINTTFFPNAISSSYWSSTTVAYSTSGAWGVNFSYGGSGSYFKTNSCDVRCVRGGQ